jgi:hypothetical protein
MLGGDAGGIGGRRAEGWKGRKEGGGGSAARPLELVGEAAGGRSIADGILGNAPKELPL